MEQIGELMLAEEPSSRDVVLVLNLDPGVAGYLDEIAAMKLWGPTPERVALELIEFGLRQLALGGTVTLRRPQQGRLLGRRAECPK